MGKNPYLPRCSWNILQLRGSLSWYRPGEITFFNYAVTKLHRCRHPYVSSYTEQRNHLHSTIFRWRQREGSGFSENLPKRHDSTSTLSEWLVPTLWSLVLISSPWHRPSTSTYSASYSCLLVRHEPHRVLCRSLAGCSQRITTPYFIRSSFLRSFFYLLSLLQDHYITTMRECQVFINIILHNIVVLPYVLPYWSLSFLSLPPPLSSASFGQRVSDSVGVSWALWTVLLWLPCSLVSV